MPDNELFIIYYVENITYILNIFSGLIFFIVFKLEVGIPAPLESKGVPAESKGTPSHPVESKVPAVVKTEPSEQVAVPTPQSPPSQPQSVVPAVLDPVPSVAGSPPSSTSTATVSAPPLAASSASSKIQGQPPADHVESLLENMFQGEAETPVKASVIVTNASRTPVLTDDKVVYEYCVLLKKSILLFKNFFCVKVKNHLFHFHF